MQSTVDEILKGFEQVQPNTLTSIKKRLHKLEQILKKVQKQKYIVSIFLVLSTFRSESHQSPEKSSERVILSGKPLKGYKCMSCDRSIASLHPSRSPFLPIHCLPGQSLKSTSSIETSRTTPCNNSRPQSLGCSKIGPCLRKGGWKPQGNFQKSYITKMKARDAATEFPV